MRLLLKWFRPDIIPSPRRKRIPFGTRLQLQLYRSCLKILRKWYAKYAYSDSISISGSQESGIRIYHEFRDTAFEAELKRLRLSLPERILECRGVSSSQCIGRKDLLFYRSFHFEDNFLLEMDGQKVSIKHGRDRTFVSTLNGCLKETDATSLIPKYAFSCIRRDVKAACTKKKIGISDSITDSAPQIGYTSEKPSSSYRPNNGPSFKKESGHLFEDDPLYGKSQEKPETPATSPPPSIKNIEGVTIDESF